jgi:hypothetical protein
MIAEDGDGDEVAIDKMKVELRVMLDKIVSGLLANSNGVNVLKFFYNNYFFDPIIKNSRNDINNTNLINAVTAPHKSSYTKTEADSFHYFLENLIKDWKKYIDFIRKKYSANPDIINFCCSGQSEKEKILKIDNITKKYNTCFNEINDNFTYNIDLSSDFSNITVRPHFNGYFVMLMIELKHDFFTEKDKLSGTENDITSLDLIKIMIKLLLIDYANRINYPNRQPPLTNTLSFIKSIDFNKITVSMFVIENNFKTTEVEDYLKQYGYIKHLSHEENDFYILEELL